MELLGFDINHWRYYANIFRMKEIGAKFIIAKCTEDIAFKDLAYPGFKTTTEGLGLPFGSYHYYRVAYDAQEQANHYFNNGVANFPPIADIERINNRGLYSTTAFSSRAKSFVYYTWDKFGRKPIIYTSKSAWQELTGNASWGADFDLWLASYNSIPVFPLVWTKYLLWQYTESYPVDGKFYDANWFNGTEEDLIALTDVGTVTPPPPLPDPTYVLGIQLEVLANSLNIRRGPSSAYAIMGSLLKGEKPVEMEETTTAGAKWSRIGWKQWACKKSSTGLDYMKYL